MLMPTKSQTPALKPSMRPALGANDNCQLYELYGPSPVALPEEALTVGKLHSHTVAHSAQGKYLNDSKTSKETMQ